MAPTLNPDVETILGNVCDVLAYYELAYKVDSTGDMQAILEANVEDACQWIKYESTHDAVSPCTPEEVTDLYKRCLAKKVYTQHSVMYSAFDSTSDHYSNVVESPAPCLWVDDNVPEPHGTTITAALQYLC